MKSVATKKTAHRPWHRRRAHVQPRTVIIGYGNTLRRDDGIGPAVIQWLRDAAGESSNTHFIQSHQLLPELSENLSRFDRAIFIDASITIPPGKIKIRRANPNIQTTPRLGHQVTPDTILLIAQTLYGHAPSAAVIAIGARSLAIGECPTLQIETVGRRLAKHLAHWLRKNSSGPGRGQKPLAHGQPATAGAPVGLHNR